jgi:hypothetical protein
MGQTGKKLHLKILPFCADFTTESKKKRTKFSFFQLFENIEPCVPVTLVTKKKVLSAP